MSDEFDFSPLDPKRDARRWEALVQRTLSTSLPLPPQGRGSGRGVTLAIARMKWGVVAFCACAALAWLPHFFTEKPTTSSPALLLLEGSDVVSMLEMTDDR